jgi:hypothetical protein
LILIGVGGLLWLVGRSDLPFGKLPGNFQFQIGSVSCIFPLATSILLSILLTLVLNFLLRLINR